MDVDLSSTDWLRCIRTRCCHPDWQFPECDSYPCWSCGFQCSGAGLYLVANHFFGGQSYICRTSLDATRKCIHFLILCSTHLAKPCTFGDLDVYCVAQFFFVFLPTSVEHAFDFPPMSGLVALIADRSYCQIWGLSNIVIWTFFFTSSLAPWDVCQCRQLFCRTALP